LTSPTIDRAGGDDIELLLPLLETLFALEEDFTFEPARARVALERIIKDRERSCLLVARIDGRIIGMCSAQLVISTAQGAWSAWVEDVVVDSAWRGKGVGSQLLKGLEQWCRQNGVARMQLVADCDNHGAHGFYQHTEWSETNLKVIKKQIITID
jgi:GNAT superfamily N-acetyltransferase